MANVAPWTSRDVPLSAVPGGTRFHPIPASQHLRAGLVNTVASRLRSFLVHRPHIIREHEHERAVAGGCGARNNSAAQDLDRGVIGEREAVLGGAEGLG